MNLSIKSLKNKILSNENEYLIGVLIIHTPLFAFLNTINLPQVSFLDIFYLECYTVLVIFVFYIITKFSNYIFFKKNYLFIKNIFVFLSIIYLGFFFWNNLKTFIPNMFRLSSGTYSAAVILVLGFIYIIAIKNVKIKTIIHRFIFLYCIINFLFFLYAFTTHIKNKSSVKIDNENNLKVNISSDITNSEKPNIYYIVFDGMMSIEKAKSMGIVDSKKINELINQKDFLYVNKSFSNYDATYLTLASIHYIKYMQNEKSPPYKSRMNYFPTMMTYNKNIPLIKLLNNNNYKYIWTGNLWADCRSTENINCINKQSLIPAILKKFNSSTPFCQILNNLPFSKSLKCQNLMPPDPVFRVKLAMNQIKKPFFMFSHIYMPHPPYNRHKNCSIADFKNNKEEEKIGYEASYNCALLKIINFIKYINEKDPSALVVIQSDHGWSFNNIVSERASIFNFFKVPKKCVNKDDLPKSNTNTLKLVLNCALNLNLLYDENLHFTSEKEGSVKYGFLKKYKTSEFK